MTTMAVGTCTWHNNKIHLIFIYLFIIYFSSSSFVLGVQQEENSLNACEFETNFIWCTCNSGQPNNSEYITCQIYASSNPTMKEWGAVANLYTAKELKFIIRPPLTLNYTVPSILFSELKQLNYFKMDMACIGELPSWSFSNSSSLSHILLVNNNITDLNLYSFAYMKNLTEINLSENNIIKIERNVFVELPNLKTLILRKNTIQVIHDEALKDLELLEDIQLQNNNLSVIVRDVFYGLKNLKRLDIRYNMIQLLGDHVFSELINLEDLDLTGNNIISVSPTAFYGVKQMHRLNMKDNQIIEFLPQTFHHFNKIHFLDLRNNQLIGFDKKLIEPIHVNFINFTTMQFMLEGNHFKCCNILWLQQLWMDTNSTNIRVHLNKTKCELPLPHKVYHLGRTDTTRKNIPMILVDEDNDDDDDEISSSSSSTLGKVESDIISRRRVNIMSITSHEIDCIPITTTTTSTKPPLHHKIGKKGNTGGGKGNNKNKNVEIEQEMIDKELASLHNNNPMDSRTESSSQSHQSNNINIPNSGDKIELLMNKLIIIAFLLFLNN